jgi:hypothetical protein
MIVLSWKEFSVYCLVVQGVKNPWLLAFFGLLEDVRILHQFSVYCLVAQHHDVQAKM